jgi:hypothetical protein
MKRITIILFVLCFIPIAKGQIKNKNPYSDIVGKWFIPHIADINIIFYKDTTFLFKDYNEKLDKEEQLQGKFELKGDKLTLYYYDRKPQVFHYSKRGTDHVNYYITKGNNYY